MWNEAKTKTNKSELIDTENRLVVVRGKGWGWAKLMKKVKRYKVPVIK